MQVFLVASALTGGAIAFGWLAFAENEAPFLKPAAQATPLVVPKMPPRRATSDFEAIVKRPLFSETRRPSSPPEPAPTPIPSKQEAPAVPLAATLIGIVISPDTRTAVLRMGDGKNVTVAEGESVDGWKLSQVMPEAVRFQHVATTIELSFPIPQPPTNPTRSSALPVAPVRRR
jgi:type II secretory pathway component PulC